MSKQGPHDECKRVERELRATVSGQAREITRLGNELEAAEGLLIRADDKLGGANGWASLEIDERVRRAEELLADARAILRKHGRRKAFLTTT